MVKKAMGFPRWFMKWRRKRPGLEAVNDACFVGIVRGHFDFHPIPNHQANEAFTHFAGDVSQYFVSVLEFHTEHGASQHGGDGAFKLKCGLTIGFLRLFVLATASGGGMRATVAMMTAGAALESAIGRGHDERRAGR